MYKKKLIETSIPLDDINLAASGEKNIRRGYPATLHLWWARRPLAAARCVIFASMVDDPSEHPELFPTVEEQDRERERLHGIIRQLAKWENVDNEQLYDQAYAEMIKYAPNEVLPEFLDPFAGGGALPLEAQRLGLISHAADLNPIPVTLNRAMIDIPARFYGMPPVRPSGNTKIEYRGNTWPRATGMAEDIRYYAAALRKMASDDFGDHYAAVTVSDGHRTAEANPIAYIWARTVTCPNPACKCEAPLVRSFWLGKKKGRRAYIEPITDGGNTRFEVRFEKSGWKDFTNVHAATIGQRGGMCVHCGGPISLEYVRAESREKGLGNKLMAIVSDSPFDRGRWYSTPTTRDESLALSISKPIDTPRTSLPRQALGFRVQGYGLTEHWQLFTNRQLYTLVGLTNLLPKVSDVVERDAIASGMSDNHRGLEDGGNGAHAYAQSITMYLAFIIDKLADSCSALCTWNSNPSSEAVRNLFARQAIPMSWDYAESNPFSNAAGSYDNCATRISDVVELLPAKPQGDSVQRDSASTEGLSNLIVSTDPPYYDNIDYSDLSDYFYIWLRKSLRNVFPKTFATMLTPKDQELIATPFRFGGDQNAAKAFFENGMRSTFEHISEAISDSYPLTIYYAYKQSESTDDGRTSSGWETMLQALMDVGLQITGTWPIRTERTGRTRDNGSNALASSVVLVCRKRDKKAPDATRPEFQRELRRTLRQGVEALQQGSIAPVDMAQASIGPGMAAFSKYSRVVESDGTPMSVHTALGIINEQLDALMGESGAELDNETRFCITWYEQFGFEKGNFGTAETLRNARGADFAGLQHAGVLVNDGGKTWLVSPTDVANPEQARLSPSSWSDLMACIAALEDKGIDGAARVLASFGEDYERGERAKGLAYILFQAAERGGRANDATLFNGIVTSWADIAERAEAIRRTEPVQQQLDFNL